MARLDPHVTKQSYNRIEDKLYISLEKLKMRNLKQVSIRHYFSPKNGRFMKELRIK